MLTSKDFDKLLAIFPTRDEVRTIVHEEIDDLRKSNREIVRGLDKLATAIEAQTMDSAGIKMQLARHEEWCPDIKKAALLK